MWFDLAVESQNIGHFFLVHEREDVYLHLEQVEPELSSIQEHFRKLEELGEVEQHAFTMPGDLHDKKWEKLEKFLNELSEEYGRFLASEMLDVGVRISILSYQSPEEFSLDIFLPPEEMKEFQNLFAP